MSSIFGVRNFFLNSKTASAKIDEQTDVFAGGSEIIHQLNFVFDDNAGNGFQFNDQFVVHNQIGFEVTDDDTFVANLDWFVGFNFETSFDQLVKQSFLIN